MARDDDPRGEGPGATTGTREADAAQRPGAGSGARKVITTPHGARGSAESLMGDTAVASRSQTMAAQKPAVSEPTIDVLLGTVLAGRYQVTRKIGQGGMGAVYEATHTLIGKRVAVKVLLDKYADRDQIVARLEQEARLASSIGHEHIIDITDFGQTGDGRTFVVMEFLEGEPLAQMMSREGPLPEPRVIEIALQMASALGAAHAKGIIHRDVKPENVFLLQRRGGDFVKVVDFGISKSLRTDGTDSASPRLTQTGMVLGTPLYMSPEQARGDDELDHRIDIYAVGVIMYEMVTGEVPFRGNNYLSIISQVLNDEPPAPREQRPELSRDLESVILRAMARDREQRYGSMDELAADLQILAEDPGRTSGARLAARQYRRPGRRRGPVLWAVGGLAVAGAVGAVVALSMSGSPEARQPTTGVVVLADASAGPAVAADAAVPDEPAVPPVAIAEIRIVSKPPGATVYAEGREIGTTPTSFRAPRANEKIRLIAGLAGHDDSEFWVNPLIDDGRAVTVVLRKPKAGEAIKKLRPPRPPKDSDASLEPERRRTDDTAGGELTGNPYD